MIRIIDGIAYSVEPGSRFRLKGHDLGNGHLEVTASRCSEVHELDWPAEQIADHLAMVEAYKAEFPDEVREKSAAKAASRARKRVRRLCKSMGANTLLTLTYRALVTDLALCKRHLKEFNRRVCRIIPGFRMVVGFEKQQRGAWHVHAGVERVPSKLPARNGVKVKSFNVLRAIWRSVTVEAGGSVHLKGAKNRSPARIASYLSKYITKAFKDGEKWSNRWTKFGDVEVPRPVDLGDFDSLEGAIGAVFQLLGAGHYVDSMRLCRWKDWFYLAAQDVAHA